MLKADHTSRARTALVALLASTLAGATSPALAAQSAAPTPPGHPVMSTPLPPPDRAPMTDVPAAPAIAQPAAAAAGRELFGDNCAVCHGNYGEGDGVMAPSLAVVLQDLRYLTARNNGQFPRDFVIDIVDGRAVRAAHGPEGMPVWGAEFARDEPDNEAAEAQTESRINALADYLEVIQITERRRTAD